MVEDYHAAFKAASCVVGDLSDDGTPKEPNNDAANFFQKLEDNEQKLFLNCKYTKLSFIVKLLHIKCLSGWTSFVSIFWHHVCEYCFAILLCFHGA